MQETLLYANGAVEGSGLVGDPLNRDLWKPGDELEAEDTRALMYGGPEYQASLNKMGGLSGLSEKERRLLRRGVKGASNAAFPAYMLTYNAGGTSQNSTGSQLSASSALTDVSPGANTLGQACTFPPSFLQPGTELHVRANGIFTAASAPTLTLGVYWGAIAGTALAVTAATTVNNATNGIWILDALCRVATTGTSGTILTIGWVLGIAATASTPVLMPATTSTGGSATVDTSTQKILTIGAQYGTAGSNTLTCYNFLVHLLA